MAKKVNRISINKWEKTIDDVVTEIPLSESDDTTIAVKYVLPLKDMLQFVDDVVSSCVNEETGEYIPEAEDFAINKGILSVYANFNMPDSVSKQYELIYNTDALSMVLPFVSNEQLNSIRCAIHKRIEYKLTMMQNMVAQQANEVISRLNNLAEQLEKSVSGMSSNSMKKFVTAIGNMGSIDEAKLAKAVLAEQSASDPVVEESADGNVISVRKPAAV